MNQPNLIELLLTIQRKSQHARGLNLDAFKSCQDKRRIVGSIRGALAYRRSRLFEATQMRAYFPPYPQRLPLSDGFRRRRRRYAHQTPDRPAKGETNMQDLNGNAVRHWGSDGLGAPRDVAGARRRWRTM